MTALTMNEKILLTRLATCSIGLKHRYCPLCHSLQFKGEAIDLEIRCRRCKQILIFQGETVRIYTVAPY